MEVVGLIIIAVILIPLLVSASCDPSFGSFQVYDLHICPNCNVYHDNWERIMIDTDGIVCKCMHCGWVGYPLNDE